ncbi:MAG: hypothetical protein D3925_10720, partial [Candidatus Electrothrix sp. AR5]|nr:hypothetical protein [Candidatus Electrothrix sp. AR5]
MSFPIFLEGQEEPVDQTFFPEEEGGTEELAAGVETGREGGEGADSFFDEVSVDTPDGAEDAFKSLPDISGSGERDNIDEGTAESADLSFASAHVSGEKAKIAPVRQSQSSSQSKRTATLRVDINRIDQMVGLSGDMVINLSSFEDSMDASAGTMKELRLMTTPTQT